MTEEAFDSKVSAHPIGNVLPCDSEDDSDCDDDDGDNDDDRDVKQ